MQERLKVIRTSTVSVSLDFLLKGQLRYLQRYFDVIAVSGHDEFLENVADREGIVVKDIKMTRPIDLWSDLVSLWKLYQFFKSEKPVIVHSITPKAGLLSMFAGWLARVPVRIHTFTGLIFPSRTGLMFLLLKNMDRATCFFATKIIPEGEGVKRDLVENHITRKPLSIIRFGNVNGVDIDLFTPHAIPEAQTKQTREIFDIDPNRFTFIFVGRLVRDKGINELVNAFIHVNNRHPNTVLILVGPFEHELDKLEPKTIEFINNNSSIIQTGFQRDVRPFYAISNVLVFPSYREGFPNVPIQAGAMGLPSIVTDINGCNEIIQDGYNGLIIPSKNEIELENAMLRLVEERELLEKLASNSRSSIVSRFNQADIWPLIKQTYNDCLLEKGII
jgi:glycosyltransferase involved in cell wall biosynthesis